MNYLNPFKIFKTQNIKSICNKYNIQNYTINEDGSIDVDGDVCINKKYSSITKKGDIELDKLPIKFNHINGNFNCSFCGLSTLKGSPKEVTGDFNCSYNRLTTLYGSPKEVGLKFNCSDNKNLITLEGGPKYVGGQYDCSHTKIKNFIGMPRKVSSLVAVCPYLTSLKGSPDIVTNDYICIRSQIKSLKGATKGASNYDFTSSENLPIFIQKNYKLYKKIINLQDDYGIWNKDESLNEFRFNELLQEIWMGNWAK